MSDARTFAAGFARLVALLVMVCVVTPAAHGQKPAGLTPAEEAAIEVEIKELATQWSNAYLRNDPLILERIWAPEFIYVEPSGHRFTKAEGIASLKAGGDRHTVSEASSVDVRIYGGGTVAVDIGDYREAGVDKEGKPFARASRFTNVWVRDNGTWRCVSGHASQIPVRR